MEGREGMIVDREEYREELIWACLTSFAAHGYEACNMAMLAQGAGVSERTLEDYFSDKRSLFDAVLDSAANADLEALERVVGRVEGPRAKLLELGEFLDRNEGYLEWQQKLWREAARLDGSTRARLERLQGRFYEIFSGFFQGTFQDPEFEASLVGLLMPLIDGLILQGAYRPGYPNFVEGLSRFADLVERLQTPSSLEVLDVA
jgi:AcrR family transcriptional regulator